MPSQTISRGDFVEIQLAPSADGKDGVDVSIDVSNNSRFTIKVLRIEFYLQDKSDKQLASGTATFTNILPNSTNFMQREWSFSSAKDRNRERNTMKMSDIDNWKFKPEQLVIKSLNTGEDIDGFPYLQLRSKKRVCQPGLTFLCTPETNASQQAAPQQAGSSNVLELEYLRDCRLFGGAAYLDIRVTNRSNYLLDYWQLNIEVSDATGKFIGSAYTNGTNLAAGANEVSNFSLRGVSCSAIKDKKASLGKVTTIERGGQTNSDAVRFFTLVAR